MSGAQSFNIITTLFRRTTRSVIVRSFDPVYSVKISVTTWVLNPLASHLGISAAGKGCTYDFCRIANSTVSLPVINLLTIALGLQANMDTLHLVRLRIHQILVTATSQMQSEVLMLHYLYVCVSLFKPVSDLFRNRCVLLLQASELWDRKFFIKRISEHPIHTLLSVVSSEPGTNHTPTHSSFVRHRPNVVAETGVGTERTILNEKVYESLDCKLGRFFIICSTLSLFAKKITVTSIYTM